MTADQPPMTEIAGHRILFVMAVAAEYGPQLQARITPLMTGVGPVEAAVAVTAALAALATQGRLPDLVVSLGSAGSQGLAQAQVYQVGQVAYRDMDASALGFAPGQTPFLDLPARQPLPLQIPGIPQASLATGASIVSGAGYDGINADMVDMETYAVLRACQHFDLPLIGLRGISDGAAELQGLSDWTQYLHLVDARLADAVDRLGQALQREEIILPRRR
ncbi:MULTISPECIES: 5'-methylthioadenosine/S-adenosylhomocysteine nucleosidase [unclassified Paracoccus (in: a-proteobacteria)]|uniref:5'-methylthioadenosine/S-adenosylhomocysteine nucleosidase n=1 Tax=unclassified Paracoccus (in: a-proteobacteria) TaxID=2688777 RepID=UPI0012B1FD06|nr:MULTISPECIES: 5'-methylthioadenosine/S-adenosylhomocysteine nucleosidase [unclassified Paracoccus (in: a-proteobacteria)]UXU75778.1 5'-methylthioadenosine/S-adenosylhomocysteine nucleosidase [Paracoccus sp. SMMA_5]UXU81687.1 5'-methylthioadenosine/S-adenosylhomocysteine nucleosidase [Paracoccus sp. SMMA_5_TC]